MWTLCTLHIGCYDGEEFGATTLQLLQAVHLHNIREYIWWRLQILGTHLTDTNHHLFLGDSSNTVLNV